MIHSVSQPLAVAWDSCLFENIIVAHFTEPSQAGLRPPPSALWLPSFHHFSLISATLDPVVAIEWV